MIWTVLGYLQIKIKSEEFSFPPLLSNGNQSYLTMTTFQAGKASLSANAPACVTVWGWEELAGCVQRRAPPLESGIALDPGG